MVTNALSAEVTAANSKLARFLRSREEEEMILQIGKHKPRELKDQKRRGASARWQVEPDWRAPTPMVDRPRTLDGATSFHFSYDPIVKLAVPTVGGKPVEGPFGIVPKGVYVHAEYIERDGAAEVVWAARHAVYVERPGAAEQAVQKGEGEGRERTIADIINEAYADEEAGLFGEVEIARDGVPSIFSNISDDAFERLEFWRSVERFETAPKTHQIILKPDVAPDWWDELTTTSLLPADFHAHALRVAESYRRHVVKSELNPDETIPFEAEPFKVDSEQAGRLIEAAQGMAHYDDRLPPFDFKSGSGGTIQIRIVAELPHEVSAEDRALIGQNFCDHLGTLTIRHDDDGKPYKTGMMFTGVIHKPDGHNDSRNFHLHVVAYDRPCEFLVEEGMWDFEFDEVYVDKSGKERTRHRRCQNKIREVSRTEANFDPQTTGLNFIPGLRATYADINNAVLEARGIKRRLDPRKYSEMGIDRTPTEHLGTNAAALEAVGVPTPVGQLNAIAIWSDAERVIRNQAAQAKADYAAAQERFEVLPAKVEEADPNDVLALHVRRQVTERRQKSKSLAEDREAIMLFDLDEAKAKSRARRTQQTCLSYLADIDADRADRTTRANKAAIEARFASAQEHIDEIDKALEPHRDALAKAAKDIEERERRIVAIDELLLGLENSLEGLRVRARVQAEAKKKRDSKVEPSGRQTQSKATPPQPNVMSVDAVGLGDPADHEPSKIELPSTPSVQPITIGGVPIIEPTITPRELVAVEPPELQEGTPRGLEPLRPVLENETAAVPREPIVFEIFDGPVGSDRDAQTDKAAEERNEELPATDLAEGRSPIAACTMAPSVREISPIEEKPGVGQAPLGAEEVQGPPMTKAGLDTQPGGAPQKGLPDEGSHVAKGKTEASKSVQLTRPQEPPATDTAATPDLSAQDAVGSAAPTTDYAKFDALVVRIKDERIPITKDESSTFKVPSVTLAEQQLLSQKRFEKRAQARLGAIHEHQRQEIDRMIRWIETPGRDPALLVLQNRTASLGEDVKASVRTLFKHWGGHEDVLNTIRRENARREELAKAVQQIRLAPDTIDSELKARREEAEYLYPTPDQAFTPEVTEFIRLLRDAASNDKLQAAALAIEADPRACEDIGRHNRELEDAYEMYIESSSGHSTQRDWSADRGR